MPSRYRLIQADVLAIQVRPDTVARALPWCNGQEREEIDPVDNKKVVVGINVPTLAGVKRASQGDYILRKDGYFDVMCQSEFESKYEKV